LMLARRNCAIARLVVGRLLQRAAQLVRGPVARATELLN